MKVIVAGSRHIKNRTLVIAAILRCPWWHEITEVICGDCEGVDEIGAEWAREAHISVKRMKADWDNLKAPGAIIKRNSVTGKLYNAKAGPDRNERMAEYTDRAIVIWNGKSPGSADLVKRMKSKGKVVFEWRV